MPDKHITLQAYTASDALSYGAEVVDRHLCGGKTLTFIAICAAVATFAAGIPYAMDGAESDVYRRAAEIKAASYVHAAGWER